MGSAQDQWARGVPHRRASKRNSRRAYPWRPLRRPSTQGLPWVWGRARLFQGPSVARLGAEGAKPALAPGLAPSGCGHRPPGRRAPRNPRPGARTACSCRRGGGQSMGHEDLAAPGVGSSLPACPARRAGTSGVELVAQVRVAPVEAAVAIAAIAALDHVGHDPMKGRAVVAPAADEFDEVVDVHRRVFSSSSKSARPGGRNLDQRRAGQAGWFWPGSGIGRVGWGAAS